MITINKIDEYLKETDGKILYNEQFMELLLECGYDFKKSCEIRKWYGKKMILKIVKFEDDLRNSIGIKPANYLLEKIHNDINYTTNYTIENFKQGKVSDEIDLSDFKEE